MEVTDYIKNNIKHTKVSGVVFVGNVPRTLSQVQRNKQAPRANNWSRWRRANYSFMQTHLKGKSGVLLDVGAGPQHFKNLTKHFEIIAQDALPIDGINLVCDIEEHLPLLPNVVDVIVSSNVLEHVLNAQQLLNEKNRILKEGGALIMTIPFLAPSHQRPHDYYRYTDITLKHMLDRAGFTKIEIIPLGMQYDILESISHKFFIGLYQQKVSSNLCVQKVYLKCIRLIEIIHTYVVLKFYKVISKNVVSTEKFTEGYGVVAYK